MQNVNEKTNLIYAAISAAMADIDAIGKDRVNKGSGEYGFKFRGIDDVYNSLHSVLAKHKIFTVSEIVSSAPTERTSAKGAILLYERIQIRYTFFTTDGSSVETEVIGLAMDSGDKAANKAMSIAHKYALLQIFCIATEDEKDPDAQTHTVASAQTAKPAGAPAPTLGQPQHQSASTSLAAQPAIITEKQRKRLYPLATEAQKTPEEVKTIFAVFGFKSSKEITTDKYDAICAEISKAKRQPGDE